MPTKRWLWLLSGLAVLGFGCGKDAKQAKRPEAAKSDFIIGVSLLTRTHPFYQDLEAGLGEAAAQKGYRLMITSGEFDVARQKDQLQDFIVRKVNAIIVCPCDSKSIGTAVKGANDAGIPVFTADIACLAEGVKVVCHVASDNVAGGRLAAQALIQAIGGKGKIAIIDHPEVESVIQRVAGFEEEAGRHPDVKIVAKLSGRGMKDQALRTTEDILQSHPELNGIFGINDDSALGALAAVEKAAKQERVAIVGFDATPEARQAIKEGKIYADVIQKPRDIGRKTIEAISLYASGQSVESQILIPCGLYTQQEALAEK